MIHIVHVSYTVLGIIQYISRYISDFIYVSDTKLYVIHQMHFYIGDYYFEMHLFAFHHHTA